MSLELRETYADRISKYIETMLEMDNQVSAAPTSYFYEILETAYDDDFKVMYVDTIFKTIRKTQPSKQFHTSHMIQKWMPEDLTVPDTSLDDAAFKEKIKNHKIISQGATDFYRAGYEEVVEICELETEDGEYLFFDDEDKDFVAKVKQIRDAYEVALDGLRYFDEHRQELHSLKREIAKEVTNARTRIDDLPDKKFGLDINKSDYVFKSKSKLSEEQKAWNRYVNTELMKKNKKALESARAIRESIAKQIMQVRSGEALDKSAFDEIKTKNSELSILLEEMLACAKQEFIAHSPEIEEKMKIRDRVIENHKLISEAQELFSQWIESNNSID